MDLKFKIYSTVYFIACFISLFFIDVGASLEEMVVKLTSLVFLAFLYISVSKKINYWYILILMCSIGSDSFFIFDPDFLREGLVLVIVERVLYFVILRKTLSKIEMGSVKKYVIPGVFVFIMSSYLLSPYVENMLIAFFIICFLNLGLIGVAFFHLIQKKDRQNIQFFLGVFLIGIADFFLAFNRYLEYSIIMVIIYTVMYYIARYLICISIIEEKRY